MQVISVGAALALLALTGGHAEASAAPHSSGRVTVSQGLQPTSIPGTEETGATAPGTTMTVSFVLKARDENQLRSDVDGGWSGAYLTTAEFAAKYGQTPTVVANLGAFLSKYGIVSTAYSDDLDVTAQGTAAEFDKALSVLEKDYVVPARDGRAAQHIYASAASPSVPASLGSHILSILGLSNYAPFVSDAVKAVGRPATSSGSSISIPPGAHTPADFENEYGLTSLEASGSAGQGETLGIVTLASVYPAVPVRFWKELGLATTPNRITLDNIDGGAGPVSLVLGSDETTLDVEQSGAIAPKAHIVVYQAPNTDYGFVDGFYAAASQNTASSVSASWGESEIVAETSVNAGAESPTYTESFDEAYLEMAAQGQSGFVSSGDQGAFADTVDQGTTALSVGNPSDSPYITAAGGTTNPGIQTFPVKAMAGAPTSTESADIPQQMAWSWDYLWPLYHAFGAPSQAATATNFGFDAGGTGGFSSLEPRPSYQNGVSGLANYDYRQYLVPTDFHEVDGLDLPESFRYAEYAPLGSGSATSGRAVPDVSLDADPETGYALYDPQFVGPYGTSVLQFGGTSFVAPQLNGVAAVYASALHHRIGFWNPVMYAAAKSSASPFTPIDDNQTYHGSEYLYSTDTSTGSTTALSGSFSNNNLYYTGTPGTIYNPAVGLGYADLGKLENDFASK